MRISSYLLLLLAFVCGVAGSTLVAMTFFWAKPVKTVAKNVPTTNIIVAKRDIPAGARLEASAVRYLTAPIDEIPETAVFNFRALHEKKSLYDIPTGCPICTEMLTEATVRSDDAEASVPPGFRIVPIHIGGAELPENPFTPGSLADITVSPRTTHGELVEIRNAVVGTDTKDQRKTILKGVNVHSVHASIASKNACGQARFRIEEVSVLLSTAQWETLLASSREGVLRLVPRESGLARASAMKTVRNAAKKASEAERKKEGEAAVSAAVTATEQTDTLVPAESVGSSPEVVALENRASGTASVLPGPAVYPSAVPLPETFVPGKIATEQALTPAPRPLVPLSRDSAMPKAEQLSSVQFGSVSEGTATLRAPADEPTSGSVPVARISTQTASTSGVTFIRPSTLTVRMPEENLTRGHHPVEPPTELVGAPAVRRSYSPFSMGASERQVVEIP